MRNSLIAVGSVAALALALCIANAAGPTATGPTPPRVIPVPVTYQPTAISASATGVWVLEGPTVFFCMSTQLPHCSAYPLQTTTSSGNTVPVTDATAIYASPVGPQVGADNEAYVLAGSVIFWCNPKNLPVCALWTL
jgi:hypothetical protein